MIWEAYYYFVPEHVVMKLDILLRGKESVYWNPADESVEELNSETRNLFQQLSDRSTLEKYLVILMIFLYLIGSRL